MTWALLCSMALAGGLPEVPAPLADECPRSYPLQVGQLLDPALAEGGAALCRGVVVPTSKIAYLLKVEAEAPSWVADIELLKVQRAELRGTIEDGQSPWVYRAQGAGVIGAVSLALWVGWYTGFNAGAIQ